MAKALDSPSAWWLAGCRAGLVEGLRGPWTHLVLGGLLVAVQVLEKGGEGPGLTLRLVVS